MTTADKTAMPPPIELPTARRDPLDPPVELRDLREQGPLCPLRYPDGHVGWLATTYAASRSLLLDPRFTTRDMAKRAPVGDAAGQSEFGRALEEDHPESDGVLILLDPPQHTRVRRAVAGYFTVQRVSEYTAAMEQIAARRLDAMEEAGAPVDLVETFAMPFAAAVLCEMLGVPHSDREHFERLGEIEDHPRAGGEERAAALDAFFVYCRGVIEWKRREPADDLLSSLAVKDDLSDSEIVGVTKQIFGAGHKTTGSMLALSALMLLEDRARWDALRADPSGLDVAIEEFLRYLTILQRGAFTRTALEDVEIEGVRIEAGQSVAVSLPAANRDPAKFDHPDELDLSRAASGHLAFGYGRHMCLGQHLARLEMKVGLTALMRRFPTLRLAVPADRVSFRSCEDILYGLLELPVAWEASA